VNVYLTIGAICLAFLTAAVAAVVVRRVHAAADDRVAEAIRNLAAGMQATMRALAVDVETTQATERARESVGELAASLDLDEVIERTLQAATAIPGVETALIEAAAPDGARRFAALGLPEHEAARAAVQIPDNDDLRAVEIAYRYRGDDLGAAAPAVRSGFVVPIRADGSQIGSLSAFTHSATRRLSDGELHELERLAARAGPALENARRYAEARALADLDALTGLHNRRYFHETLAREISRAHRYARQLAVVVFDLDDFQAINDRVGHLAGDAVLAEVAERMRSVVRTADIPCRVGGDEFGVVLPESGAEDAELLADRIARAVSIRPIGAVGTLFLAAGVAELHHGDRGNDLFQRADAALHRAKALGKARTTAAGSV
jgi:diguanylate cyclase (GGDEF)-like protein